MKIKKITIVTAEDYYFGFPTIERLLKKNSKNIQSVIVVEGFFSIKRIFYLILMFNPLFLLKKFFNSKKNKKNLNKIFKKKTVNFFFTKNINSHKTINFLKKQNSTSLVILSCPQILKKKILSIKKENVNYHCSNLPRNRGLFPIFYEYISSNGKKLFCNLHYMNEKIDDGRIINFKIIKKDKFYLSKMYEEAFIQFEIILRDFLINKFRYKKNDRSLRSYNSYPKIINFVNYYKILLFS